MNIHTAPATSKSRASVILIILVFLGLMALIVVSNNLALNHLDRNLRLIEQKQLRKAGVVLKDNRRSK
jgi:hypothetical protein